MMIILRLIKDANIAPRRKMRRQVQSAKKKNVNKIDLGAHSASCLVMELYFGAQDVDMAAIKIAKLNGFNRVAIKIVLFLAAIILVNMYDFIFIFIYIEI